MRSTAGASKSGTLSAKGLEPKVQGTPAIATRSLTERGMPAIAPASPWASAFSCARAAASATSGVRVTKALICGSSASWRASVSSTSSTGEMLPAASRRLSSSAVM